MRRALHKVAHEECPWGVANWSDCDKATDNAKADWDAMQQVILAYNIAARGGSRPYKKDKGAFAQLVLYIAGDRGEILNEDGNASQAPWVLRLRSAIERFIAGDLPVYNLYEPAVPAQQEAEDALQ
jgi:hypothetical protein